MPEKICTFGPDGSLVGILSEPAPGKERPGAPVVVSSNVGLNHRVGPFRALVDLARRLSELGYPMLRFDLSGLGDSPPRRDSVGEIERAVLDVKEAMAAVVARRGASRFIQLGFCSGVDSAHAVAAQDLRVVGGVFIEGYAFRTPGFYLRRYLKRPLSSRFWRMYAERKLAEHLPALAPARVREAGNMLEIYIRNYPTPRQLSDDFANLVGRSVPMLFVHAGGSGADHAYNYAGQFFDVFPELAGHPLVEVEFYPRADHVFSVLADRERLIERITRFIQARFP